MRLIFKILAVPFVAVLTVVVWFFAFLLHFSSFVFGLVSTLLVIGSVVLLFTHETMNGCILLVIAFLVSPFGLPMAAAWLVGKLAELTGALKTFIVS